MRPSIAGFPIVAASAVLLLAGCTGSAPSVSEAASDAATTATSAAAPMTPSERCGDLAGSTSSWITVGDARYDVGIVGDGPTTVVFTHQNDRDSCGFWSYAVDLADRGVRSMLLNLCGYAQTDCPDDTDLMGSGSDAVLAAADAARQDGADRVVAVGASMGGVVAVAAAAKSGDSGRLDAVADLSGPVRYEGMDALAAARSVTVPGFFAVSPDDPAISPALLESIAAATPGDDVVRTDGVGHGWDLLRTGAIAADLTAFITGP
ncbi:MAG: hypothetical protein ABWX82_09825 [Leifsonia sp.]